MARVECLKSRPIPDGHLAAFLRNVKSASDFQGIALTGSLKGTVKRRGGFSKSLQSEIETAVDLCNQRLNMKFGILINACKPPCSNLEDLGAQYFDAAIAQHPLEDLGAQYFDAAIAQHPSQTSNSRGDSRGSTGEEFCFRWNVNQSAVLPLQAHLHSLFFRPTQGLRGFLAMPKNKIVHNSGDSYAHSPSACITF
ncbi:hypothetical protein OS493_017536 [Desmophyllum pertusum]|uniref:Uncharacterized protein n=1 Tax=Desmophyllum pertusum TaxID=174260 RepID=A0A9W9ZQ70_9CNID|nr:hypothetical protein OS493_017536 [Desmophyllum pertusum]